jgi:hypothetical protein
MEEKEEVDERDFFSFHPSLNSNVNPFELDSFERKENVNIPKNFFSLFLLKLQRQIENFVFSFIC